LLPFIDRVRGYGRGGRPEERARHVCSLVSSPCKRLKTKGRLICDRSEAGAVFRPRFRFLVNWSCSVQIPLNFRVTHKLWHSLEGVILSSPRAQKTKLKDAKAEIATLHVCAFCEPSKKIRISDLLVFLFNKMQKI